MQISGLSTFITAAVLVNQLKLQLLCTPQCLSSSKFLIFTGVAVMIYQVAALVVRFLNIRLINAHSTTVLIVVSL